MRQIIGLVLGLILIACEGPAGPQGPMGPSGPRGEQGLQGISREVELVFIERSMAQLDQLRQGAGFGIEDRLITPTSYRGIFFKSRKEGRDIILPLESFFVSTLSHADTDGHMLPVVSVIDGVALITDPDELLLVLMDAFGQGFGSEVRLAVAVVAVEVPVVFRHMEGAP
ncbi:MAG: hypothetical protein GKR89_35895 [Candidatus Latescibacteria bacterium]|nr:hypothetical protein [Candidatus Latescibacterota bacterium]